MPTILLLAGTTVAFVGFLMMFGPIVLEYFFHPAKRQERRHRGKEWTYATVDLPHTNMRGDHVVTLERQVKFNIERDEYFIRNRRPRCHGRRWEPGWIELEAENIIEKIHDQA